VTGAVVAGSIPPLSPSMTLAPLPLQVQGDWAFVLDNWWYLTVGAGWTVALTVSSVLLGVLVGFPAGAVETYGGPWARSVVSDVGVVLRGTPLLVILFFFYFGTPVGSILSDVVPYLGGAFLTAVLGLGLRSGAYQSQIFRGAFQSVDRGQMEAARAVGLSKVAAIRHVVVPQAFRRSVPGFQNEMTIVLKDTSIAFAIGISELLARGFDLFTQIDRTGAVMEVILTVSLVYFVLTFVANRALDLVSAVYGIPTGENA